MERPDAASLPLAEQAQWLWESYKTESGGGSYLEADAFSPSTLLRLPPPPPPAAGSVGDSGSNSAVGLFGRLQAALGPGCASALSPPASAPAGSPCVLVVAGAALRCLELLRSLPEAARRGPGAKLFGKHLKAADQAAALGRAPVGVAVGTPARLATLAAGGGLRLDGLRLVVLDCGRDLKLRCVLDIPETRRDFWALWRGCLAARVAAGHTKVALL